MYTPLFPDKKKSKRTGKTTCALCGFAPTSRHLAPFDDPDTVIVGLNEAYNAQASGHKDANGESFMKRWDAWFQMHSSSNFTRKDNPNDPKHWEWLQKKHDFPILMQKKYKLVPSSVAFPLNEYAKLFPSLARPYATSTLAYMFGWALLEGFERIELYGFEMASGTEYAQQRPCGEFLLGFGLGLGVDVYLPPICGLLKGQLYGYEKMSVGYRQQLELREYDLKGQLQKSQWAFHYLRGQNDALAHVANAHLGNPPKDETGNPSKLFSKNILTKQGEKEIIEAAQKLGGVLEEQRMKAQRIEGAIKQAAWGLEHYDQYPFEQDMGDSEELETDDKA